MRILLVEDSRTWNATDNALAELVSLLDKKKKYICFLAVPEDSEIHEYYRDQKEIFTWRSSWLRSGIHKKSLKDFLKRNFIDVIHCLSSERMTEFLNLKESFKLTRFVFEPSIYLPDMAAFLCRSLREDRGIDAVIVPHGSDAEHLFLAGGDPQKIYVIEKTLDPYERALKMESIYLQIFNSRLQR